MTNLEQHPVPLPEGVVVAAADEEKEGRRAPPVELQVVREEEEGSGAPPATALGGGQKKCRFKLAGSKVRDEARDTKEHESFVARQEHFGRTKKDATKKSKTSIARGAIGLMFNGCAVAFNAWRDYSRAKHQDKEEMNATSHASDVLQKQPWQRTPREIRKLRAYLCSFVRFIETLNAAQQRQLCKVATLLELPGEHVICETGDPGNAFYIILRGRLSLWHGHAPKHGEAWDENARIQSGLTPGDSFGELALQDENGVRSVTVKTEEPTVLAVLSKRNYMLTVQNVFEQLTRDRVDFLCRIPTLQHESLSSLRTLALYVTETTHKPGDEIIKQSAPPRSLSFVLSGTVDIRISMRAGLEAHVSEGLKGLWKNGAAVGVLSSKKGNISLAELTQALAQTQQREEEGEQKQQKQDQVQDQGGESTAAPPAGTRGRGSFGAPAPAGAVPATGNEPRWMRLGMLGVGSHVGERALCTKRRHTFGAVARTPCTTLMLAYTDFQMRVSDKTHELMLALTPKTPSVESVNRTLQQDERWRDRRMGIMEETLTAAQLGRKPGSSFLVPERSVLGQPGFGPGAMAGDADGGGAHRGHRVRRGGSLPSLSEENSSSSSSSSSPPPPSLLSSSSSPRTRTRTRDSRGRAFRSFRGATLKGDASEKVEELQPSTVIAAATSAMVSAAIGNASAVDNDVVVGSPSLGLGAGAVAENSSPGSGKKASGAGGGGGGSGGGGGKNTAGGGGGRNSTFSFNFAGRGHGRSMHGQHTHSNHVHAGDYPTSISPDLAAKLSSSPATKALEELAAKAEEKAATASFRGGDCWLDETFVDFLPDVPFLSVLLEEEIAGNLLAMEAYDELFQAWTEDCVQRKIQFVRYTHNRCVVFNPGATAAPTGDERREAADELADVVLAMRDDVAEMALKGGLARNKLGMSSPASAGGNPASSRRDSSSARAEQPPRTERRREGAASDGDDSGGGGDDSDDDASSARSRSTTSTARQLQATGAFITGTRAAMWAGLGFGNLFVTYAAKGSFVASFYGSAASAADAMLREAYASTKGPPGSQDTSVGGEIRADFTFADELPPSVFLREVPPASPSPLSSDPINKTAAEAKDEEPRATVRPSPYVVAIEQRLNQVQGRGAKRLESESLPTVTASHGGGAAAAEEDSSSLARSDWPASVERHHHPGKATFVVLNRRQGYRDPQRKHGWGKLRSLRSKLALMCDPTTEVEQQPAEARAGSETPEAEDAQFEVKPGLQRREQEAGTKGVSAAGAAVTGRPTPAAKETDKWRDRKGAKEAAATSAAASFIDGGGGSGGVSPPRKPGFPPMRQRPGAGELQPCNSARSLASDRSGIPPARRGGLGKSSNVAQGTAAAAAVSNAANLGGRGGKVTHARVTVTVNAKRPLVRRERSAAAERFLPQIFKRNTPPGGPADTATGAAALLRRETFLSTRFGATPVHTGPEEEA